MEEHEINTIVPVPFSKLKNVRKAVEEHLQSYVNKWNEDFQGVMQSYTGLKVLEKKAKIIEETSVILVKVKLVAKYFSPKPGQKLTGTLKTWSEDTIGLMVGIYNAAIPIKGKRALKLKGNDLYYKNKLLTKNQELEFQVSEVETEEGMIRIIGELPNTTKTPHKKRKLTKE